MRERERRRRQNEECSNKSRGENTEQLRKGVALGDIGMEHIGK